MIKGPVCDTEGDGGGNNMPWYMNPEITCKVMHRIAARHASAQLRDLQFVLDHTTEKIWNKQERYHNNKSA